MTRPTISRQTSSSTAFRGSRTIAAAFYPKPVIVRLSDFKTNEYARLLGGAGFEPKEDNPDDRLPRRLALCHPAYATGFALECRRSSGYVKLWD